MYPSGRGPAYSGAVMTATETPTVNVLTVMYCFVTEYWDGFVPRGRFSKFMCSVQVSEQQFMWWEPSAVIVCVVWCVYVKWSFALLLQAYTVFTHLCPRKKTCNVVHSYLAFVPVWFSYIYVIYYSSSLLFIFNIIICCVCVCAMCADVCTYICVIWQTDTRLTASFPRHPG